MSTNINANILKNFITQKIGGNKVDLAHAQNFGVDANKFKEANVDENSYLDLDEILEDNDLYEQFATLYVEEKEQINDTKDAEQEKEEQTQVKDKNGAGV